MHHDLSDTLTLRYCVTAAAAALNVSFNQLCESSSVKLQAAAEEKEKGRGASNYYTGPKSSSQP